MLRGDDGDGMGCDELFGGKGRKELDLELEGGDDVQRFLGSMTRIL